MIRAPGVNSIQSDDRLRAAAVWAASVLGMEALQPEPVSGDASFRRYFRVRTGRQPLILMDARPDREDSRPFVDIAQRLVDAGLNAPAVIAFDFEQGFGLLEDFGDVLYRELLDEDSVDALFPELFAVLEGMATRVDPRGLPAYDERLLQSELDLFTDWYLRRHRGRSLEGDERMLWASLCGTLIESARSQPQVFVHKDFHSCNLLQTPRGPGLIDFQDGVCGPVSYDLVSLLWDRYIAWPRDRLEAWMLHLRPALAPTVADSEWIRHCDLMGLQRNLKIVGIFARLNYRDSKAGYLELVPRFYRYLQEVLGHYPELDEFRQLLEQPECAP